MLAEKINSRLAKTIIEPKKALETSGVSGTVLSMIASWHRRIENGKEEVDMANFEFLIANNGRPLQVEVAYENGEMKKKVTDLSKEMGEVKEEEEFCKQIRLLSDAEILEKLEKDRRVEEAMRKAKHLRVFSMSFLLYDEEFQLPIWHILLKNWPLTSYFKREKPVTIEAYVNAMNGNVIKLQKII